MSKYREITVCADIMKVSGVHFFMLVFKNIFFCTVEYFENDKVDTLMRCIGNIQRLAAQCGFRVVQFDMDGEFKSLHTKTSNVPTSSHLRSRYWSQREISALSRITPGSLLHLCISSAFQTVC